MKKVISLFALASILASLALFSAEKREFAEQLETVLVEVPVHVLGKGGEPIRGLTAEDFEVYDEGDRQQLVGFEAIDLERLGAARGEEPVPISARRHFLFLFDLSFSDPVGVTKARRAAQEILRNELHSSDLVGVATYDLLGGPRLVLGFTPDRRQAEMAIETLGMLQRPERFTDPLGLMVGDPTSSLREGPTDVSGADATETGSRAGPDIQSLIAAQIEDTARQMAKSTRQERIGQVEAYVKGLQGLGSVLDSVQGRKHVVLLSEGVDTSLMLGTEDRATVEAMAAASADGEYWKIDSQERYGSTAAVNVLENSLETLRRSDVVIQAVDIGGLEAGKGRDQTQDSLLTFAKDTGGQFFANTNDLARDLEEMLDRTSVTYVLAFQPEDLELDGSYHRLKVELIDGPKGARIVHRPGYYAPKPYGEQTPMERRLRAAEKIVEGREVGALDAAVLAAPFPGDAERSWVPVLIEIPGRQLLAGSDVKLKALPVEVYVYALDREGRIRDLYTKSVGLELAKVEQALRESGLKLFGSLDLEPGSYTVRALVREGVTGRTVTRTAELAVPARGSSEMQLLPPFFPEERGKWLLVQDVAEARERGIAYPFMVDGGPFVPAARPEMAAGAKVPVALMGYNLEGEPIEISSTLLGEDGERIAPVEIALVSSAENSTPTSLGAELAIEGVESGRYTLVIELRQGDRETTSSIPVSITG